MGEGDRLPQLLPAGDHADKNENDRPQGLKDMVY